MPNWGEILNQFRNLQQPQVQNPQDELRRHYIEKLNEITDRDVILYSSGWTHHPNPTAQFSISESDLHALMEMFYTLDGPELDLILHSPGGPPTATESLVDYIRSKFDDVRVFVPHAAMSAATMMCCAADKIVMGRHSFLGPIDPQITLDTPTGFRAVPAQAILQQFEQATREIEDDQANLAQWTPILRQYGPGLLVECRQAIELGKELAEDWAAQYLFSAYDDAEERAEKLATTLSDFDRFRSHGRHINRERARECGFVISDLEDDQEIQDTVLSIYHASTLTHVNTNTAKIMENHNRGAYIQSGGQNQQGGGQNQLNLPNFEKPPGGPPQRDE